MPPEKLQLSVVFGAMVRAGKFLVSLRYSDAAAKSLSRVPRRIVAGHGLGPLGVAAAGTGQAVLALARQGPFRTAAGNVAPSLFSPVR